MMEPYSTLFDTLILSLGTVISHFGILKLILSESLIMEWTTSLDSSSGTLKGHCIEFKYYADGIHSRLTPPGNNS